jgi:dTDP-4-dehydrorhamnose reductase
LKALITGGGGQLASDLQALLGGDARSYSHAELDIRDRAAVLRALDETRPDVIFNCAAFHNVDVCEHEPETAWAVNVEAVRGLASAGLPIVHLSTNYVFDGRAEEPYGEDELPAPRSVYALTKLAGEYAALAYGSKSLVVRSAGLYGLHGSASKGGNFVQRMISRASEQGSLSVVSDQRLQPTFTLDLAQSIQEAVDSGARGIVHLTSSGECSWYEFTVAILERAGIRASVEPIATTKPPGGVDRPLNGILSRPRADQLALSELRPWRQALDDYMERAGLAG